MNTQTQQEMMNHINQTSIATTDKANTKYQIELLIQRTKYTWDIEKNMRKIILGNTKTWQIKNERQS